MTESGTSKNNASSEIPSSYVSTGNKLFSMKLFSSWDGEKSAPNCIPRLCTLTITRLVIKKPLETESNSVIIAIKMRGSKRILRSNEIAVQKNGLVDSELDLLFSLQYPHHLKRDGNRLQIMLQRRKKYKNRTMLGFKTLAAGHINMSQVLQHSIDQELDLHSSSKDGRSEVVAKVAILSLSSQPVDQDDVRSHHATGKDRYANYDTWDDEEMQDDGDISSNDGLSDFEVMDDNNHQARPRNKSTFGNAFASQQKNLKQKFIKLIRKFKVSDEVLESAVQEIGARDPHHFADDDLFDDVESLSDSNPDVDAISLQSVPKPKLKPFFDANQSVNSIEIQKQHLENVQQPTNDNIATATTTTATAFSSKKQENKSEKKSEKNISDIFVKKNTDKTNAEVSTKKQDKNSDNVTGTSGFGSSDKKSSDKQLPALFSGSKKGEKNPSSDNSKKTSEFKTLADSMTGSQKKSDKTTEGVVGGGGGGGGARKVEQKPVCYELKVNESDSFQVKLFQDQISAITCTDQVLPNCVVFMNYQEPCCLSLKQKLDEKKILSICTSTHADVKTALNAIVNRIQKFMNTSSLMIKLVIMGGEGYLHSIVRPFVKVISSRSPDIVNHVRFLVVPLGNSFLCQNLAQLDGKYSKLFNDEYWKELTVDKIEAESDLTEVTDRLMTYMKDASFVMQLPFSEVVLTNKDKGPDDSSQMVVPFLGEIKLKPIDMGSDVDDGTVSTSPPQTTFLDKLKEVTSHSLQGPSNTSQQQSNVISVVNVTLPSTTQPSSMASTTTTPTNQVIMSDMQVPTTIQTTTTQIMPTQILSSSDELELQMDYWMVPKLDGASGNVPEKNLKKDAKFSLKTAFKSVQIFRPGLISIPQLPQYQQPQQVHDSPPSNNTATSATGLSMIFVTKDKKQKIMRIGKKSRDDGLKSQQIDGISRLICTSKSQNHHLTVNIDGMDWTGIKFFQVSTHWQTHCKHLPVLIFGSSGTDISMNN